MIKAIHKISSPLMALIVLVSTFSFTLSMHFCEGELIRASILEKVHSCGAEMTNEDGMAGGCCHDKEVSVEGQDTLNVPPSFDSNFNQLELNAPSIQPGDQVHQLTKRSSHPLFDPSPQWIVKQLFKEHQVYLI